LEKHAKIAGFCEALNGLIFETVKLDGYQNR
jgi:hypothetical protein